jgi:hypothetical protein
VIGDLFSFPQINFIQGAFQDGTADTQPKTGNDPEIISKQRSGEIFYKGFPRISQTSVFIGTSGYKNCSSFIEEHKEILRDLWSNVIRRN